MGKRQGNVVDRVRFAIMARLGIRKAFTLNAHFRAEDSILSARIRNPRGSIVTTAGAA